MSNCEIQIVEIASGAVIHRVPCNDSDTTSRAAERRLNGVLNNIGRFDCRLSRGGENAVDDRLDLDRYFARYARVGPDAD